MIAGGSAERPRPIHFEAELMASADKAHLDLLLQSAIQLNSTLDLNLVLKSLLSEATRLVGAENGFILLRSGAEWTIHLSSSESEQFSHSIASHAAESGQTLLLVDAYSDPRFLNTASVQSSGVRSILCAPLIWGGEVRGAIYLDNRLQTGIFKKEHQQLIEALSRQAAIALENAALHEERERIHDQAMARARKELAETQAQLLSASKMAAVGELAAGIAHELNNPLCAIALNLDSVSAQLTEPKLNRRIEIMSQAVARCRSIIDNLLRFSHPGAAEVKPFGLHEVVAQALELMHFQLREIQVEQQLEEAVIEGNASSIAQVLINLLGNARDAVPSSGGRIAVRCFQDGVLEIEDNGCGMTEETRERLFEPFYTTKQPGRGTGLGWSVSYQFLKEHAAGIEIESAPGEGTLVRLKFPTLGPGRG